MKRIICRVCNAPGTLRVVSTRTNPGEGFQAIDRLKKCGVTPPYTIRVKVCENCGAAYQTVEVPLQPVGENLTCPNCGQKMQVRSALVDPVKPVPEEKTFIACGFQRPFILRTRVCRNCGTVIQFLEFTIVRGGRKKTE